MEDAAECVLNVSVFQILVFGTQVDNEHFSVHVLLISLSTSDLVSFLCRGEHKIFWWSLTPEKDFLKSFTERLDS